MAGKHRRRSRLRKSIARGGTGLATAAVGATSVTTAIVTGTAPAIAPAVQLMAVITPANSTAQFFAGTTYYGTDFSTPAEQAIWGDVVVVPFLAGPQGIADAINTASAANPPRNIVLASGWGAGQTGSAFNSLTLASQNLSFFRLDNNTNRAGGGFWTTYAVFAPLLGTSSAPTPDNLGLDVLDVGYQYNINSDAVTYPLNVVSLGNSLAAYAYDYGGQETAKLPETGLSSNIHYIVDKNTGRIVDTHDIVGGGNGLDYALNPTTGVHETITGNGWSEGTPSTVYITFVSGTWEGDTFIPDVVPLLRPLNLLPGGDILARTLDPVVSEIVNAGYKDNQPVPDDPTQTRPMGLGISETATALTRLPGDVVQGLQDGAKQAQKDFSDPGSFVSNPINEFQKLPGISSISLPNSAVSATTLATTSKTGSSEKGKTDSTSSTGSERPRPLKKLRDGIRSSLHKLTGDDDSDAPAGENDGS